ncbi:hypothetical protein [Streptococcus jiangjianxini]|uniref:hypothetical protein n=1 Tax=Streptococcus jiangjianxini TaxID=3161189 RepID=UPI0032F02250
MTTMRIKQDFGLPPKIAKIRGKKPMPKKVIGQVLFENVNDYISIVDGRRVMFDKLTNLEVNTKNWPQIASERGIV